MNPIIIDLSKGWDAKEISKLIKALTCSEFDKQKMEQENLIIERVMKWSER